MMKSKSNLLISLALALLLAMAWATPAYASAQTDCTAAGGTWDGTDPINGTCTYAAGSTAAVAACNSTFHTYQTTFVAGVQEITGCRGRTGTVVAMEGPEEESFVLRLGRGKNGWVEFFAGACKVTCTINTALPNVAKDAFFRPVLATLYVRIDGGYGSGGYRVCFDNPLGKNLTIYLFYNGAWVHLQRSSSNPICGVSNGDSSFFLGGSPNH